MANKMLESLTIGGTTFDVHNPTFLIDFKGNVTFNTTSTWIEKARLTITEAGLYYIEGWTNMVATASSGYVLRGVRIFDGSEECGGQSAIDGANWGVGRQCSSVRIITTVPTTVRLECLTTHKITNPCWVRLTACKIMDLAEEP